MAKVAIVDDDALSVLRLGDILTESGHTVLTVCANAQSKITGSLVPHLNLISSNLEEIRQRILGFEPDFVLLDHSLELPFSGEDVANVLGIESTKLVGTSNVFDQKYCSLKFRGDKKKPRENERKCLQEIIGGA